MYKGMSNIYNLAKACCFTIMYDPLQEERVYNAMNQILNFPKKKAVKLITGKNKLGVNFSGLDGYIRLVNRKAYIRLCYLEEKDSGQYEEIAMVMKEQYEGLFEVIMKELYTGKYDKQMADIVSYIVEEMFEVKS